MESQLPLIYGLSFLAAALAFAFAVYLYLWVKRQKTQNAKIIEVAALIKNGANTFMRREYKILAVFAGVAALLILILLPQPIWKGRFSENLSMALAYLMGTALSAVAGKIGILVATHANSRTAEATRHGIKPAFLIGFRGGSIMGLTVVGFSLLGVAAVLLLTGDSTILLGFSFGASSLALFMSNSGGLWDNSKKYIESGHEGGKGSDAHKAAVVGDTVGDPFKDTAGPSINTQITVVSLVSSLMSALFVAFSFFG